jgi:predicted TPR repeat methyltransferase
MKKAMDLKATDPIALFNYAVYAQNAGDLAAAESAYEKTLALDPGRALAHYHLGLMAVNKEQNDAAIMYREVPELAERSCRGGERRHQP